MICRSCRSENPAAARFCMHCGGAFPADAAARGDARPPPARGGDGLDRPLSEGERRHITVMFCDLVGSTELSQRLDPETLGVAIQAYQESCGRQVEAYGGMIAQYLGDGLLVYFGYPTAHEDDAARAVQAALRILEDIPRVGARLADAIAALRDRPLEIRIGIHTGEVVLGALDRSKGPIALGDTTVIAARLQDLAEPGSAVLSATTMRLVREHFEVEPLGPMQLRGIARPLEVYRVVQSEVSPAADPGAGGKLTPLVGRDQEISLLLDHWEHVANGRGRAVLLSGDAGIGKSRLLLVLRERLAGTSHTWLEVRCSPYYQNSAFHPVLSLLRSELGIDPEADPTDALPKLEAALAATGLPLAQVVPVLARFLSVPQSPRYTVPPATPDEQRREVLASISAWLSRIAEARPVVLVVEDLHWVDPSTLELLTLLIGQVPQPPLLLLLTARPNFRPDWASRPGLAFLPLHPLTRQQMVAMVESMSTGRVWPRKLLDQLIAKADGVPLYVEELARTVIESASGADGVLPTEIRIPSTLQSSLTARLDRLGPAKEVAQLAAVLGREFSHEVVSAVASREARSLESDLNELVRAGLLHRHGHPPRADYTFKHALVQDAAYESLLLTTRRQIHRRVAVAIEQGFPERAAGEPEVLAHHYEEAGCADEASRHYQRASELAAERSANTEAVGHLRRGIATLAEVAPSPGRSRRELAMQVHLGVLSMAADGASHPDVEQVFARVRALCDEVDVGAEVARALFGLSVFHQARAELDRAMKLGEQLLALSQRTPDRSIEVSAHLSMGIPLFWQGQPAAALSHLERTKDLYDPHQHRDLAYAYGQDPGVSARCYAAVALWQLGQPERALTESDLALEMARDDLSVAFALAWAAWLAQLRGETDRVKAHARRMLAISNERGYVLWGGVARAFTGWVLAQEGNSEQGVGEIESALAQLSQSGSNVVGPVIVSFIAEAFARGGRRDAAINALDTALAMSARMGAPYMDCDLRRMRADLVLEEAGADPADAVASLRDALQEANARGARSYALRAATSLARRLARDESHALLAEALANMEKGSDARDVREARALLDTLA